MLLIASSYCNTVRISCHKKINKLQRISDVSKMLYPVNYVSVIMCVQLANNGIN